MYEEYNTNAMQDFFNFVQVGLQDILFWNHPASLPQNIKGHL